MTSNSNILSHQLIIRAGNGTLSFLVPQADGTMQYHPYPVKSGMSLAANLREAFKEQPYLATHFTSARLMIPSPVVLIPREDYEETVGFDAESMYSSVLTGHKGEEKLLRELPQFEAMALYSVNSDLKMVVGDNCERVEVVNVMLPVWEYLYKRYYQNGDHRKMFAYFHDKSMDVCCFEQRRLHFANVFNAQHAHDAVYYLLFAWKQLGLRQNDDDLFIVGDMPHRDWLVERLKTYISNVHVLSPAAMLSRSPLSLIDGMPFDMMI